MITLKINPKDALNKFKILSDGVLKARLSANYKTAKQATTQAKREIRSVYNIKAKYLNQNIKTHRGSASNHAAKITATGQGIRLKAFGAKQVKTGVSVQVKKGNRKIIKHAFGPKIPRLGGNVFVRSGKERLPIKKLFGPGAAAMFGTKKVMGKVKTYVKNNYKRIYEHALQFYIKK